MTFGVVRSRLWIMDVLTTLKNLVSRKIFIFKFCFLQKFLCKVWMTKSRQLFFGYFIAYNDSKFACKIAKKYSMRGMESIKRTKTKKSSDNKPKKNYRGKPFNLVYFVFAWTHQFQYWNLWFKLTFQHSTFMRNEDKVTSPRLNGI